MGHQTFTHCPVALGNGQEEGRVSTLVHAVNIAAVLHDDVHDVDVATVHGSVDEVAVITGKQRVGSFCNRTHGFN